MAKQLKIAFSINSWTEQVIELETDEYTQEEVLDMLLQGTALTTIQEGGDVLTFADSTLKKIGTVVTNEMGDGEYTDYELLDTLKD